MASEPAAHARIPGPMRLAQLAGQAAMAEAESWVRGLPGHRFGVFGRALGARAAVRGKAVRGGALLLTPVNSVRYWEFDFADRHLHPGGGRALDVSSPRLLSLYLAYKHRFEKVVIANPDESDLKTTRELADVCGLRRIEILVGDAATATSSKYNAVWSISVVEHIPGEQGDRSAVRSMFEALEPGGSLVITVPVDRISRIDYRPNDVYGLGLEAETDGGYFFQRYYDQRSIRDRLIKSVDMEPVAIEWFGETQAGVFETYEQTWRASGFAATVQDPAFIARNFKSFDSWEEMPGVGVCGLAFRAVEKA
jgi:SAM-dependent methyltransferase